MRIKLVFFSDKSNFIKKNESKVLNVSNLLLFQDHLFLRPSLAVDYIKKTTL